MPDDLTEFLRPLASEQATDEPPNRNYGAWERMRKPRPIKTGTTTKTLSHAPVRPHA